jgi:hypothetical protein
MNGVKERAGDIEVGDAVAADVLAREMEEAALRYAQMTEQLDRVLQVDRRRRRGAWRRADRRGDGEQS